MRRDMCTLLVALRSMWETGHISSDEGASSRLIENEIAPVQLQSGKIVRIGHLSGRINDDRIYTWHAVYQSHPFFRS